MKENKLINYVEIQEDAIIAVYEDNTVIEQKCPDGIKINITIKEKDGTVKYKYDNIKRIYRNGDIELYNGEIHIPCITEGEVKRLRAPDFINGIMNKVFKIPYKDNNKYFI